ncbi:hypothetical protein QBC46DRAFT_384039 [Diplogelasinospora grovesii]|uniref:Ketoreductase domain-containing protein n=1 Tax=Diplogelasinospora grovesii TaxID=303347 RepID=A0AAN6NAU7_9PEZI|nr:hypothetical protein QBC46DRAFT_384039 [Diplogelasinospora grovesii]
MPDFNFDPERDIPDLSGRVILITGGTGGLGAASAVLLARHNPARIYISGRRSKAAESVIQEIREAGNTTTDVRFLFCDLADLSSVKAAAEEVLTNESDDGEGRLDMLIANAGVAAPPPALSKDGYEVQFATNHLGHALLIQKLLPLLSRTAATHGEARIVSVGSFAYRGASGIPLDRMKAQPRSDWTGIARWRRYGESKLASAVYTRELGRRHPEVLSASVTPGFVSTAMVAGMTASERLGTKVIAFMAGGGMVEPEQGALNQVWAAAVDKERIQNGAMYDPVGVLVDLSKPARDEKLGQRLWEWTEAEIKKWL